ncbi:MAG: SRPBCC family protein [Microbacterium sp.]
MDIDVSVDRSGAEPTLLFTVRLAHPPARVWRSLTDSEQLSRWYPCRVELEPRLGGRIAFLMEGEAPEESIVTEFDEPRTLAYEWGGERLRWSIEPEGDGSILRLSNTILDPDWMPRTAAGWDSCLEALSTVLAGDAAPRQIGPDAAKIARYRAQLAE